MKKMLVLIAMIFSSIAYADHPTQVGQPMVEAAKDALSKGMVLLDVRQEACEGYVKGAQIISIDVFSNSPQKAVADVLKMVNNDKNKPVAVYCRSGVRAARAINVLKEHGFTSLHNLGGVGDYYDAGSMQKCE